MKKPHTRSMKSFTIVPSRTEIETTSFKLYLKDIAELDILTPEEEMECVKKASSGDKKAIDELVTKNLRFVVSVAKKYVTAENKLEDLVNEGNIGLYLAAINYNEKYRTEENVKFTTYAVWAIRKSILEYLANNGRTIRIPQHKLYWLSKLDKEINTLEQKLNRTIEPTEAIIEGKLSLDTTDILNSEYNIDSLDREVFTKQEGGVVTKLSDTLSDENVIKGADHLILKKDLKDEISRGLDILKPRDRSIMIALFGLNGEEPKTLYEVGEEMDLSYERVRQIKEKTLLVLKHRFKKLNVRETQ